MIGETVVVDWPCLVAGERRLTGAWHDVRSPYDGRVVSRVAWARPQDLCDAVRAADEAMTRPMTPGRREQILRTAATLVERHGAELASLICAEGGKPLKAARIEVARTASTLATSAGEATRLQGEQVPLAATLPGRGPWAMTIRKPAGVVGAITPFNFPLNLVAHKVGPALAGGCAVVLKPADKTPGPAVRLAELLADAGLPDGWLSVVCGPPAELADVLLDAPAVRIITFTGSARVGLGIAQRGPHKRVKLELGNVTPAIVAADADLTAAAAKLSAGAFGGSGQACISVQRIYVERSVYESFLDAFLGQVVALRTGDPADEATDVGPLITPEETERVVSWIDEACALGAQLLAGGHLVGGILEPTVLTAVPGDVRIAHEEVFGPVVCVWPYDDLEDALAAANGTNHGLQVALFTNDLRAVMHASTVLEFGGIIVNDSPSYRADEMPYGGVKGSGNTREGPAAAVREMTDECLIVVNA